MQPTHTAETCRWAQPELFVPLLGWVDMWRSPWRCVDERLLQVALDDRRECATCARWSARAQRSSAWVLTQVGI